MLPLIFGFVGVDVGGSRVMAATDAAIEQDDGGAKDGGGTEVKLMGGTI